ncbi:MAG: hypothetical protein ACFFG0_34145 [Candidatus Thorarchaeota archaeon]
MKSSSQIKNLTAREVLDAITVILTRIKNDSRIKGKVTTIARFSKELPKLLKGESLEVIKQQLPKPRKIDWRKCWSDELKLP